MLLKRKPLTDVVGIELGAGLAEGVPAVRLRRQFNAFEVVAAGFLPLTDLLPDSPPPDGQHVAYPVWRLPKPFCSKNAALAISSSHTFLRHSTGSGDTEPEQKQFPYRILSRVLAPNVPALLAGVPEFQAKWAASILPEGKRPTARSIQISQLAALAGYQLHTLAQGPDTGSIAMFVFPNFTALAAFQNNIPVLYREHPIGSKQITQEIASKLQLEPGIAVQIMDDASVDSSAFFEPVLRPLFRQVEILGDYLTRRRNSPVKDFYACGEVLGKHYWQTLFQQMLNAKLTIAQPLERLSISGGAAIPPEIKPDNPRLMVATGAAIAALEDTP